MATAEVVIAKKVVLVLAEEEFLYLTDLTSDDSNSPSDVSGRIYTALVRATTG